MLPTVPAPQVTRVTAALPEPSALLASPSLDVRPLITADACTVVVTGEVDHLAAPCLRGGEGGCPRAGHRVQPAAVAASAGRLSRRAGG